MLAKYDGVLEIDELRVIPASDDSKAQIVVSRLVELRLVDPNTKIVLLNTNIPYGAKLFFNNGDKVVKGDVIAEWDPFNAVIILEAAGKLKFDYVLENITYKVESDEQTGLKEKLS